MDSTDVGLHTFFRLQYGQRLFLSCLFYPVEQAKIQIKIRENPTFNPRRIITEVRKTYRIVGFTGCYTGLVPWFASTVTYRYTFNAIQRALQTTTGSIKDRDLDDLTEYRRFRLFAHFLGQGIICRTVAVVVSHPFYVVSLRMVAELFADETKYTDLIWSLCTILREEGLRGLFAGLYPRLLADLTFSATVATLAYLVHRGLTLEASSKDLVVLMINGVTSLFCTSLSAVSTRMAINSCPPPHTDASTLSVLKTVGTSSTGNK